jgi:hypothetical protein
MIMGVSMRALEVTCLPGSGVGSFGEKLRKQRELRGISLDAISTTTKISTRMLRAIEDEHFDQLPGGVFNKGFVRAYARQVGLDEEEVVNDYLAALRETQIHSQAILPNFRNPAANFPESQDTSSQDTSSRDTSSHNASVGNADRKHADHNKDLRASSSPGNGLRASGPLRPRLQSDGVRLKDSASNSPRPDRRIEARRKDPRRKGDRELHPQEAHAAPNHIAPDRPDKALDDAVPSAPLSFLNLTSAPSRSHPPSSRPEPLEAAPTTAGNIPSRRVPWEKLAIPLLVITLVLAFWAFHRRSHAATASPGGTPQPSAVPVAAVATPTTESSATPSPSPVSRSDETAMLPARSAPVLPAVKANLPVSKPHARQVVPPSTFTLIVRAAETSWVSIAADGQPAARETLIAPANTSVRASHEIVVETGNAAGVSFLLNGKEIPAHGSPGESRTYTFDASGLRASYALPAGNGVR